MFVAWLVLAIVLVYFELHHLAFYALFGAVGALAAAGVALAAPSAVALQGGVAVGVAIVGVVAVRPLVRPAFIRHRRGDHVARGVHGGLIGQEAMTLDAVGESHHVGHARLAGERWLAISGSGRMIPPNTPVTVTAVAGTTLTVWSLDEIYGSTPPLHTPPTGADGDHVDRDHDDRSSS